MKSFVARFVSLVALGALVAFPAIVLTASAALAAPAITVTPSTGLSDGQSVTVSGTGYDPTLNGGNVSVIQCTTTLCDFAPGHYGPAPVQPDGSFSTSFTVHQTFQGALPASPDGPTTFVDCGLGGCAIAAYQSRSFGAFQPISFGSTPASMTLTPADATNTVGTTHTVTASVLDQNSAPFAGVTVRVSVSGSVSASLSCVTAADGTCSVSYTGPDFPGADLIAAYADSDGDGTQDVGEPSAEATKAWVLPTSTPGQVTGGGQVLNSAATDEVAFGFNAQDTTNGPKGNCNLVDPAPALNTKIKCLDVTALVVSGNTATIWGNATVNNTVTAYRIDVVDNGEPGTTDSFRITTSSGYSAGGTLRRGNIQIH